MKILVVYASTHNATAEIAHLIGTVLRRTLDCKVDIQRVESVHDITPYDAVVLGSAVYAGQWQTAALHFLKDHEEALAERLVWVFSSGPASASDPDTVLRSGWYPEAAAPAIRRIKPRHVALFQCKLDPNTFDTFERHTASGPGMQPDEFRDWNTIKSWAESIAYHLKWHSIADPDEPIPAL